MIHRALVASHTTPHPAPCTNAPHAGRPNPHPHGLTTPPLGTPPREGGHKPQLHTALLVAASSCPPNHTTLHLHYPWCQHKGSTFVQTHRPASSHCCLQLPTCRQHQQRKHGTLIPSELVNWHPLCKVLLPRNGKGIAACDVPANGQAQVSRNATLVFWLVTAVTAWFFQKCFTLPITMVLSHGPHSVYLPACSPIQLLPLSSPPCPPSLQVPSQQQAQRRPAQFLEQPGQTRGSVCPSLRALH
jgi:hypothetical protein